MIRVKYDFIAINKDDKREYGSGYSDFNDMNEIDICEIQESLKKDLEYKKLYITNVWLEDEQKEPEFIPEFIKKKMNLPKE